MSRSIFLNVLDLLRWAFSMSTDFRPIRFPGTGTANDFLFVLDEDMLSD
jgi:hypothetical protein